jgi:hypothetical protein
LRYGSFDYDAIMFQISRLPHEKLVSSLDETRCRALDLRFAQARRMEGILVSEGYIRPVGPPAGAAAKPPDASPRRRREATALAPNERTDVGSN